MISLRSQRRLPQSGHVIMTPRAARFGGPPLHSFAGCPIGTERVLPAGDRCRLGCIPRDRYAG